MRRLLPALVFLAACAGQSIQTGDSVATKPAASLDALREKLQRIIAATPGADVAVYYRDLGSPDSLTLQPDISFHAASTMKVPVMIELFRRVDAKTLKLDQTLMLTNTFASIVDSSTYTLTRTDDSDNQLYTKVGTPVPLRELNDRMITRSSNLATNTLIGLLDARKVNATAHALGAKRINVLRGVEDQKAFDKGLNNTTTARDLGVLMAAIEQNVAASPRSCAAMKSVLTRQEFNAEIPAGLPAGTPVAHKTGWITGTLHDAAVVYPKGRKPYVLVVLTRKIPLEKTAQTLIAEISREVFAYAMK
jgi:beta-lactamase class A